MSRNRHPRTNVKNGSNFRRMSQIMKPTCGFAGRSARASLPCSGCRIRRRPDCRLHRPPACRSCLPDKSDHDIASDTESRSHGLYKMRGVISLSGVRSVEPQRHTVEVRRDFFNSRNTENSYVTDHHTIRYANSPCRVVKTTPDIPLILNVNGTSRNSLPVASIAVML